MTLSTAVEQFVKDLGPTKSKATCAEQVKIGNEPGRWSAAPISAPVMRRGSGAITLAG